MNNAALSQFFKIQGLLQFLKFRADDLIFLCFVLLRMYIEMIVEI